MLKILSTLERPLSEKEIVRAHYVLKQGYEHTEEEIWGKNYDRLFIEDFTKLVEQGVIYIAYLNEAIVGCVHIYPKSDDAFGFSLLSVDFEEGGKGIGTALIEKAESIAISSGAKWMKIEILRVKHMEVPHKLKLAKYYERLGYNYIGSDDADCLIPEWKYKLLVAPSNFDFYEKEL